MNEVGGVKAVRVEDRRLAYSVAGSGSAVLCVQGVGVVGEGWRPQVTRLATIHRLITFDNCGIGNSDARAGRVTIEAMAADALAIADAEGLDTFHLVGHSMGGLIAQHLALVARSRIKSLALLCTFANGRDAVALSWQMLILGLRSRLGTRAMRRAGMLRMIMPADYLRTVDQAKLSTELRVLFGRDLGDQPPIVRQQLRAMARYDATPRLPELAGIPTLVLSGRHDPIARPVLGRSIAAAIPGARFVEFGEASHALPIQCADRVNDLLLEHFRAV